MDSAVNWEHALDAVGGDGALLREIAQAFVQEVPVRLEEIRRGLAERAAVTVKRGVHTLRGCLLHLGNEAIVAFAEEVESYGAKSDLDTVEQLYPELQQRVALVIRCVEDYLAQGVAPSSL